MHVDCFHCHGRLAVNWYISTSLVLLALNLHFLCLLVQHCTSETWFKECLAQLKCLKFIRRVVLFYSHDSWPSETRTTDEALTRLQMDHAWGIAARDGGRVHASTLTWTCNLTVTLRPPTKYVRVAIDIGNRGPAQEQIAPLRTNLGQAKVFGSAREAHEWPCHIYLHPHRDSFKFI
jgi:hypothetical protein